MLFDVSNISNKENTIIQSKTRTHGLLIKQKIVKTNELRLD